MYWVHSAVRCTVCTEQAGRQAGSSTHIGLARAGVRDQLPGLPEVYIHLERWSTLRKDSGLGGGGEGV